MKKTTTTFLIKLSLLSIPVLFIVLLYLLTDPFKVLYHYSSYYNSGKACYITLNRDYVSTETFKRKYGTYQYDSFIFGSSRSFFYRVADWKKQISSDRCYHFNSAAESMYGIYKKVMFLKERNVHIANALLVLDHSLLNQTENSQGHLFVKHPDLSGESKLSFQVDFFKAYCSPPFLGSYTMFKVFNLRSDLLDMHIWDYDPISNELRLTHDEDVIKNDQEKYYRERRFQFYKRDTTQYYSTVIIKDEQKSMLNEIAQKFKSDHTKYKVIISPLYDQLKLNATDLASLQTIFGKETVFDFSGINEITNNKYNYYETSHYRPSVTGMIIQEIYRNGSAQLAAKP